MAEKMSYKPAKIGTLNQPKFEKKVTDLIEGRVGIFDGEKFSKENDTSLYKNPQEFVRKNIGLTTSLKSIHVALEIQRDENKKKGYPKPDKDFEKAINHLEEYIHLIQARCHDIIQTIPDQIDDPIEEKLRNMGLLDEGDPIYRSKTDTFETPFTKYPELDKDFPKNLSGNTILGNLKNKKGSVAEMQEAIIQLWQYKLTKMRKGYETDKKMTASEIKAYRKARKYSEQIIDQMKKSQQNIPEDGEAIVEDIKNILSEIKNTHEYSLITATLLKNDTQQKLLREIMDCCIIEKNLVATMGVELLGDGSTEVHELLENATRFGEEYLTYIPSIHDYEFPGGPYQLTKHQLGESGDLSKLPLLQNKLQIKTLPYDSDLNLKDHHVVMFLSQIVKMAKLIELLERDNLPEQPTLHPKRKQKLLEHLQSPNAKHGIERIIGYMHHNPLEAKWILKRWIDDDFESNPEAYVSEIPDTYFTDDTYRTILKSDGKEMAERYLQSKSKDRKNQMKTYIRRYVNVLEQDRKAGYTKADARDHLPQDFQKLFNDRISREDLTEILKKMQFRKQGWSKLAWSSEISEILGTRRNPKNMLEIRRDIATSHFRLKETHPYDDKKNLPTHKKDTETTDPSALFPETDEKLPTSARPYIVQPGDHSTTIVKHFKKINKNFPNSISGYRYRKGANGPFVDVGGLDTTKIGIGWQFVPDNIKYVDELARPKPTVEKQEKYVTKDNRAFTKQLGTYYKPGTDFDKLGIGIDRLDHKTRFASEAIPPYRAHLTFDDLKGRYVSNQETISEKNRQALSKDMDNLFSITNEFAKRGARAHFFINAWGGNRSPLPQTIRQAKKYIEPSKEKFIEKMISLLNIQHTGLDTYVCELYNHTAFHEHLGKPNDPKWGVPFEVTKYGIETLESWIQEAYDQSDRSKNEPYPRRRLIRYPYGAYPRGADREKFNQLFQDQGLIACGWTHAEGQKEKREWKQGSDTLDYKNGNTVSQTLQWSIQDGKEGKTVLSHVSYWSRDKQKYLDFIDANSKKTSHIESPEESSSFIADFTPELSNIWTKNNSEILKNTKDLYTVFEYFSKKRTAILEVNINDTNYKKLLELLNPKIAQFSTIKEADVTGNTTRAKNLKTLSILVGHMRDKIDQKYKIITPSQAKELKKEWQKNNIYIISTHATRESIKKLKIEQPNHPLINAPINTTTARKLIEAKHYDFKAETTISEDKERTSLIGFDTRANQSMNAVFKAFKKDTNKKLYINGVAENIGHALGTARGKLHGVRGNQSPAHINGRKIDMPSNMGANAEFLAFLKNQTKGAGKWRPHEKKANHYRVTVAGQKMIVLTGAKGHYSHYDIEFEL